MDRGKKIFGKDKRICLNKFLKNMKNCISENKWLRLRTGAKKIKL